MRRTAGTLARVRPHWNVWSKWYVVRHEGCGQRTKAQMGQPYFTRSRGSPHTVQRPQHHGGSKYGCLKGGTSVGALACGAEGGGWGGGAETFFGGAALSSSSEGTMSGGSSSWVTT